MNATLTPAQAAARVWDALVVGAGPAGALAARQLARGGATVLLVDKAAFPRRKVCGCCLNAAALAVLRAVELGHVTDECGAPPLNRLQLAAGRRQALISLPTGAALSRETFDAKLVECAIASGAHFLPKTQAALQGMEDAERLVVLRSLDRSSIVRARVVLAADGLGGRLLQGETGFEPQIAPAARLGVGAIAPEAPAFYQAGTIHMACAEGGYLGLVRLEDGRLDLAAALDPAWTRQSGGPGAAATHLLHSTGWPAIADLQNLPWRGTPALTRRPARVAAQRLFVLGDAAGYVEPFTGEGMAWALASALALAPLALQAIEQWEPRLEQDWTRLQRQLLGPRRRACRWLTRLLRRPRLTRAAISLLSYAPALATPLVRYVNKPFPQMAKTGGMKQQRDKETRKQGTGKPGETVVVSPGAPIPDPRSLQRTNP